jgi:D-glycero-D-manno-heptose 1,7-bisphosphate phosphatase
MRDAFAREGVTIDGVYFCPYHPEHGVGDYKIDSPCRKPAPGMLLQAAKEFEIDLSRSILIGDKESDIQAGMAAGVGLNLLYSQEPLSNKKVVALASLLDAIPRLSSSASV